MKWAIIRKSSHRLCMCGKGEYALSNCSTGDAQADCCQKRDDQPSMQVMKVHTVLHGRLLKGWAIWSAMPGWLRALCIDVLGFESCIVWGLVWLRFVQVWGNRVRTHVDTGHGYFRSAAGSLYSFALLQEASRTCILVDIMKLREDNGWVIPNPRLFI